MVFLILKSFKNLKNHWNHILAEKFWIYEWQAFAPPTTADYTGFTGERSVQVLRDLTYLRLVRPGPGLRRSLLCTKISSWQTYQNEQ